MYFFSSHTGEVQIYTEIYFQIVTKQIEIDKNVFSNKVILMHDQYCLPLTIKSGITTV